MNNYKTKTNFNIPKGTKADIILNLYFNIRRKIVCNTMLNMIFQYGWEPVLIHLILIRWKKSSKNPYTPVIIFKKYLKLKEKPSTPVTQISSFLRYKHLVKTYVFCIYFCSACPVWLNCLYLLWSLDLITLLLCETCEYKHNHTLYSNTITHK